MQYMAQEGSEASVASSSTGPNWWEMQAWSAMSSGTRSWQPPNPTSLSSCDDQDLSISNATSLTIDSSPSVDPPTVVDTHLWNQVLLNAGGMRHEDVDDGGENFLDTLNAKSLTSEMFDPACDYLKKMDSSWEFANNPSGNNYGRMTNLSDLVSNWSIAPPDPQLDRGGHLSPSAAMAHYSASAISHVKHEIPNPPSYRVVDGAAHHGSMPCYDHRQFSTSASNGVGYHNIVINDVPWSNTRNLSDLISFSSSLSKPAAMELRPSKPYVKNLDSDASKKQGCEISSTRVNSRSSGGASEGKKKRSEDSSETLLKKSKHDNSSTTTSLKEQLQVPKVKIADKITALQQIVSPFGKTDTASVLLEAIKYITFLHEQVQLLSDPYMKSSVSKDQNAWGGKEKGEAKVDLRNRGLCLVPISCTPQVYRDNSGPDYWTPPYSSCLYR